MPLERMERMESARLGFLRRLDDLASESDSLIGRTPYGYARYGGELRPLAEALQALADKLRNDTEALI